MNNRRIEELLSMFNEAAPITRFFGMTLSYTEDVNAVIDLPYNPSLDHALGGVHGGVYATMLDSVGWLTAAAAHDLSCWLATAKMSVHFLEPVKQTSLRTIGRLLKRGKRQVIAEMRLYDGRGRLVGHATGTFIVLRSISLQQAGLRNTWRRKPERTERCPSRLRPS